MDVREKLMELLEEIPHPHRLYPNLYVDRIIAKGVTVQEWISVDDRLPEDCGYVVCIAKSNQFSRFMPMVARIDKNGWANPINDQYFSDVTHLMPLPDPQKGK